MTPDSSEWYAAEAMRADAAATLLGGLVGMGVLGLHASGRSREAFGLAMFGAACASIAAAARLHVVSQRLAAARAVMPLPGGSQSSSPPFVRE